MYQKEQLETGKNKTEKAISDNSPYLKHTNTNKNI